MRGDGLDPQIRELDPDRLTCPRAGRFDETAAAASDAARCPARTAQAQKIRSAIAARRA